MCAVSYTHLDVYKRQVYEYVKFQFGGVQHVLHPCIWEFIIKITFLYIFQTNFISGSSGSSARWINKSHGNRMLHTSPSNFPASSNLVHQMIVYDASKETIVNMRWKNHKFRQLSA